MGAWADHGVGCSECVHFLDDPRSLERCFPGIRALSSAFGSSRGRAGLCRLDDVFLDPRPACAHARPRSPLPAEPMPGYGDVTTGSAGDRG
jgi:hypothetical protein